MVRNWSDLVTTFRAFESPLRLEALEGTYRLTDDCWRTQLYSRRFASERQGMLSFMFYWVKEYEGAAYHFTNELYCFYFGTPRVFPSHSTTTTFFLVTNITAMRFAHVFCLRFVILRLPYLTFLLVRQAPYISKEELTAKLVLEWWKRLNPFKYLKLSSLPTLYLAFRPSTHQSPEISTADFAVLHNTLWHLHNWITVHTATTAKAANSQFPLVSRVGLVRQTVLSAVSTTPVFNFKNVYDRQSISDLTFLTSLHFCALFRTIIVSLLLNFGSV